MTILFRLGLLSVCAWLATASAAISGVSPDEAYLPVAVQFAPARECKKIHVTVELRAGATVQSYKIDPSAFRKRFDGKYEGLIYVSEGRVNELLSANGADQVRLRIMMTPFAEIRHPDTVTYEEGLVSASDGLGHVNVPGLIEKRTPNISWVEKDRLVFEGAILPAHAPGRTVLTRTDPQSAGSDVERQVLGPKSNRWVQSRVAVFDWTVGGLFAQKTKVTPHCSNLDCIHAPTIESTTERVVANVLIE